jgi:hypothetical protein
MTAATRPALEGQDWEDFCVLALEHRHRAGPQFQKVPARFSGDWGLEGFVRDRSLYQCLGDESGTAYKQRSEAQQNKLHRDIPKLQKNAIAIAQVVGVGIESYQFLVSELKDKEVVRCAGNWTEKVRDWKLPFLADHFEIVVKDIDHFAVEWQIFHGSVRPKLALAATDPEDHDLGIWKAGEPALITTLDSKLNSIAPNAKAVWIDRLVRYRVMQLDRMRALESHPALWQRVREINEAREVTLDFRSAATDPHRDIQDLAEAHRADLCAELASLSLGDATSLAWGSVGEWLMRCPLKYDGPAS